MTKDSGFNWNLFTKYQPGEHSVSNQQKLKELKKRRKPLEVKKHKNDKFDPSISRQLDAYLGKGITNICSKNNTETKLRKLVGLIGYYYKKNADLKPEDLNEKVADLNRHLYVLVKYLSIINDKSLQDVMHENDIELDIEIIGYFEQELKYKNQRYQEGRYTKVVSDIKTRLNMIGVDTTGLSFLPDLVLNQE